MKKLFLFLFASMLLCSCSCLLSQIPPKYVYADENCTAVLKDYRDSVTVHGGCTGFVRTQTPAPGYLLTKTNRVVDVVIQAENLVSKSNQVKFTVTMIDSLFITPNPSFLTEQAKELYDAADKITLKSLPGAKTFLVNISMPTANPDSISRIIMDFDSINIPIFKKYGDIWTHQ